MVTVRAVTAHEIPDRAPLRVTPGQQVQLGERDTTWPEFVFVTADDGSGWVPARHIEAGTGGSGVVRTAYDTTELPTAAGDELTVLEADEISGWSWVRSASGREGWVPSSTILAGPFRLGPVLPICEPDDGGDEDEAGAVDGGAFGVAGGQVTPLLEPAEAPFHDVALLVGDLVEVRWPAAAGAFGGAAGDLVGALGDGVADAAAAQGRAGGVMGVALVGQQQVRALARPPAAAARTAMASRTGSRCGLSPACPPLSSTDSGRPRPSTARWILVLSPPATGPAPPRPLQRPRPGAARRPGRGAPFLRAPAECWCARTTEESTATTQSTGCPSSRTCALARILSQVPSAVHRRSRSWQVFHGPYAPAGPATAHPSAASTRSR